MTHPYVDETFDFTVAKPRVLSEWKNTGGGKDSTYRAVLVPPGGLVGTRFENRWTDSAQIAVEELAKDVTGAEYWIPLMAPAKVPYSIDETVSSATGHGLAITILALLRHIDEEAEKNRRWNQEVAGRIRTLESQVRDANHVWGEECQ